MSTPLPRIGFVGLGLMGIPMCRRLLKSGAPLTVWNRSPEKSLSLRDSGVSVAVSLAELTTTADIIMLCVSDTQAVESVVFGKNGIASCGQAGKIVVDFSSIDPQATREFASRLQALCGMRWVDAPVSGGVIGAESGSLVIMAGGCQEDIESLRPLLAPLSQRVTRMGDVGAGQVTKVCNQLIVAANSLLIAEAVALADRAGVDATQLAPALAGGFADSKPFQILAPRMAAHEHEPVQWRVATLAKDLRNAMVLAEQCQLSLTLASRASAQLENFANAGHGQQDLSSIIALYES